MKTNNSIRVVITVTSIKYNHILPSIISNTNIKVTVIKKTKTYFFYYFFTIPDQKCGTARDNTHFCWFITTNTKHINESIVRYNGQ